MRETRGLIIGALLALVTGLAPILVFAAPMEERSARLLAAYNGFGQRLFKEFANKPGNVVFSPYSVGSALAMALAGARGATETEMAQVLGLELSRDEVNAANAALLATLNRASSKSLQLHVANALVLTGEQTVVSKDYMALLEKNYAAEVFRGGNLATVNAWVKQKTEGKIDSILKHLDPKTALVLIDAIYFKASWQNAFDVKATHNETFHLLKGTAKIPLMEAHGDFALAKMPGYQAIRLPYAGARTSMIVILPAADIASVLQRLDSAELRLLLTSLHTSAQPVDFWLPRFKTNFQASLVKPLTELGMRRAFNPLTADFSGVTGKPLSQVALAIDQIVHRAVIDVREQGTEAAAATAESESPRSAVIEVEEKFRVDRPFLFVIIDDETDAVLFEGLIVDPRQVR